MDVKGDQFMVNGQWLKVVKGDQFMVNGQWLNVVHSVLSNEPDVVPLHHIDVFTMEEEPERLA
jgi:hypothetical protein